MIVEWFSHNWSGLLLAPVFYGVLMMLLGFSFRQVRAVKEYYVGIPITQWLGMWFIVLGCKIVRTKKYCHMIQRDGRFWISPNTKGFAIPEETQ